MGCAEATIIIALVFAILHIIWNIIAFLATIIGIPLSIQYFNPSYSSVYHYTMTAMCVICVISFCLFIIDIVNSVKKRSSEGENRCAAAASIIFQLLQFAASIFYLVVWYQLGAQNIISSVEYTMYTIMYFNLASAFIVIILVSARFMLVFISCCVVVGVSTRKHWR